MDYNPINYRYRYITNKPGQLHLNIRTFKYTNRYFNFRVPPEGFPWPARPFKHTESHSFIHTVTLKYTKWYFILPPGPGGLARPPHI